MIKISYRYRKYVMIAGSAIALLLLYLLVYNPLYAKYQETLADIDRAESRLDHSRRLVQQQEAMDRQVQQLEGALKTLESSMFEGETSSLVGAKMQDIMNDICRKNGADIRQTRVLNVAENGPYKEISINVDMSSDLEALTKVIFELNNSAYTFMIPEVSARSTGARSNDNIRARLTVVAFMRAHEAVKSDKPPADRKKKGKT